MTGIIEPQAWMTLPERHIHDMGNNTFMARVGKAVRTLNMQTVFVDDNVQLDKYTTSAKDILGYSIRILNPSLLPSVRPWHLSIIHPKVTSHFDQRVVFNDKMLYLRKFNNELNSYWLTLRHRTT